MQLRAPAKLNLYLRVLGKRPDGYHELETVFERLDLADELVLEAQPLGISLTCSEPALTCGEDNLVLKAARLLQQETGSGQGARMHLHKRIPIAAGLGGGSSDGAAALIGLNKLWGCGLPQERLAELAGLIGSDVSFFISGMAFATGRGRGERCEPLSAGVRLAHVLVVPHEALSTADVYAGAQFDLTARKPSINMVAHALRNGSLGELADGLWNDLEPEAIRRCPVISHIQLRLRELGCIGARVSGSGPAVFGLCRDLAHAQEIARRLAAGQRAGWRIHVVQTAPADTQRQLCHTRWGVV